MPAVSHYNVLIYGSPEGYQTNRSQIVLYSASNTICAYVRFNDPGMVFENDRELNGIIYMYLPSSMFQSVLDLLRNEKPIKVYLAHGKGFLGTSSIEPVGEAE